MKKSILILLSVSLLCLALVGCGKQEEQSATSGKAAAQPQETAVPSDIAPAETDAPSQPPVPDNPASDVSGDSVNVAAQPQEPAVPSDIAPTETEAPSQPPVPDNPASNVSGDSVDLTALSSTMVYAEVYNMMYMPENYVGRTVTMRGQFGVYAQTESGPFYFICFIADATACCQQGLEFVLAGDVTYPDDYPEIGSEITVTGEFQTYEENGFVFFHLVEAQMS